ncbi:MAG: hypothetical protein HC890_08045 [Chloroflexaceae bacterium]|nr:hypothetical protein [Chloroflexaceae bacterium]
MDRSRNTKVGLLYPCYRYQGPFKLADLAFNANLQEFAHQVGYISSFHTNGKLSTEEACARLQQLWQQFEQSKRNLDQLPSNF